MKPSTALLPLLLALSTSTSATPVLPRAEDPWTGIQTYMNYYGRELKEAVSAAAGILLTSFEGHDEVKARGGIVAVPDAPAKRAEPVAQLTPEGARKEDIAFGVEKRGEAWAVPEGAVKVDHQRRRGEVVRRDGGVEKRDWTTCGQCVNACVTHVIQSGVEWTSQIIACTSGCFTAQHCNAREMIKAANWLRDHAVPL